MCGLPAFVRMLAEVGGDREPGVHLQRGAGLIERGAHACVAITPEPAELLGRMHHGGARLLDDRGELLGGIAATEPEPAAEIVPTGIEGLEHLQEQPGAARARKAAVQERVVEAEHGDHAIVSAVRDGGRQRGQVVDPQVAAVPEDRWSHTWGYAGCAATAQSAGGPPRTATGRAR